MFCDINKLFCVCICPCDVFMASPIIIIIFSGGSFFFNPSSFPHFLENSKLSSDLSYFAFIKGERSGLFDDILAILSPFTYRKGTITYFLWSEYNQVFTLWRFNIVGKSFCLWVLHRRMHPIQCNFLSKEPHRTI